ncbi:hypothetical protein PspLS_01753 [Pyricularia sp. CBS 133598]|nr:hypothetical protein PspLS_01753 [Pyricularia sp. CBS 133598]
MVKFDLIRHGESCSNVHFTQDAATGKFTHGPFKDPNPSVLPTTVPGDHFFATVLTPFGVAQCVAERRRLELPAAAYPVDKVEGVFSSPLERAVETAILTTPFAALKKCGWTVKLVPYLQEAVKYQCDVFSSRGLLEKHVEKTRKLYVEILKAEERKEDAKALQGARIRLDWTAMDGEVAPAGGSRTRDLVNESEEKLEARAVAARKFLATQAVGEDDDRYLLFTHGQITEYLLKRPLCNPYKAKQIEFVLKGPNQVPDVVDSASLRVGGTASDAKNDTEARIEEGSEKYRVQEKVAWMNKMGRVPADVPAKCLDKPVPGAGQWPVEDGKFFRTTSLPENEALLKEIAKAVVAACKCYNLVKPMQSLWKDGEYSEKMMQRTVDMIAK